MSRGNWQTTVLDADGDVQIGKAVILYEANGTTPLVQPVYASSAGGAPLLSLATDGVGQIEVYADTGQYLTYRVDGGIVNTGRLDPDPGQIVTLTGTQILTNKTLTSPTITGGTIDSPTITTPSISAPTITGSGTFVNLAGTGTFRAQGNGGTNGIWIDANGRIGMFDQATGSTLAVDSSLVCTKVSTLNEVFLDHQLVSTHVGTIVDSGTASAGGATTLTDAAKAWTVNAYAGKIVRLVTGTGSAAADPYRYIVSNTATALTVTPAWTVNPAAGTTYTVHTIGDLGTSRFIAWAFPTQVASTRAIEAQMIRQAGSADSGSQILELGLHTEVDGAGATFNVGINLFSSTAFLAGGGAAGKRAGIGLHIYGDLGWAEYWRTSNTAGTMETRLEDGGHLSTSGKITAGATAAGASRLNIKQSADNGTGGLTIVESAAVTQIAQLFTGSNGGDPATYLIAAKQGVSAGTLRIGSIASDTALRIASAAALAGDLLQAQIDVAAPVFAVTKDGYVKIGGTKVLGTQGAAVADATGAGDVVAQLNALLARARAHGWIAT